MIPPERLAPITGSVEDAGPGNQGELSLSARIADACDRELTAVSPPAILAQLQERVPELRLHHAMTWTGWHRLGGVVDVDHRPVAPHIDTWVQEQSGGDLERLLDQCAASSGFVIRLEGRTHWSPANGRGITSRSRSSRFRRSSSVPCGLRTGCRTISKTSSIPWMPRAWRPSRWRRHACCSAASCAWRTSSSQRMRASHPTFLKRLGSQQCRRVRLLLRLLDPEHPRLSRHPG